MTQFVSIFIAAHSILAIIGCLSNLLLAYLAVFRTPRVIRSYATLILNFAVSDFLACFFDLFVQQRIIPAGTTLGYISSGFCKHFGPKVCYVSYSFMLHCLSHSLWSLLLSFSYRYYILFKPAPSRKLIAFLLLLIYQPSLLQLISLLWAYDEPSKIESIVGQMFPDYNLHENGVLSGTINVLQFSCLYTILHMTVPITPVYTCILILRRRIIQRLSYKDINITQDTKNLHTQLLMALTYQAAIPGFYLFSVLSYSIGQLGIYHHPALEYFTFSSFLFIPLLSPLASFIFVTPYRHFILRVLHKLARKEYKEHSATHHYAHSSHIAVIG